MENKRSKKSSNNTGQVTQGGLTKQIVRQMINSKIVNVVEKKWYRFFDNAIAVDYSGGVALLFAPGQGDTDTTRNGDRIYVEYVDLLYSVITGDATNLFRVIIFLWKPNTVPIVGSVLETTGTAYAALSGYLPDNVDNYVILHDQLYHLSTYQSHQGPKSMIRLHVNKHCQYQASSTTNGSNLIYRLVISDSSAADHPGISTFAITRFTDA